MTKLVAISKSKHKNWYFKGITDFSLLNNQNACQITLSELKKVSGFMPLFFHKNKNNEFNLCSLNGFYKDNNLLVNKKGQWMAPYVPAVYRSLPFYLTHNDTQQNPIICFDEDLNCVFDENKEETCFPFFDENGKLSKKFDETLNFIQALRRDIELTNKLVNNLNKSELITEWDLSIRNEKNENYPIKGLYKVDEKKFNELPNAQICNLFKSRAIELAYFQIYSMENLQKLASLQNLVIGSQQNQNNVTKELSHREKAVEKQKKAEKEEMDTLVKNLMSDD